MRIGAVCGMSLLACLALGAGPVAGQTSQENVELILSNPETTQTGPKRSIRSLYQSVKQRLHVIGANLLPLTRCEKWSVPKQNVESVKKEAAKRGVVVTELSPGWNRLFRVASGDLKMTAKQQTMVDQAKASKSTTGVRIMTAPPPAVLEHALTKDAKTPTSTDAAKVTVMLSDNEVLTVVRTSIDIRPGLCVWRGTVEQTGALVTLMWWPNGTMAGTLQKDGRLYSIRHLGARFYAIVEMSEERMPQEHAPMTAAMRANDPNLRDDPLVQQGDASKLRPVTAGARPPSGAKGKGQQAGAPLKKDASPGSPPKDIVIDVIIAYTKKAASYYTDVKRELVDLSIEEANESFRMSKLGNIKLRLVHAYQTDYVEEGEHFQHVWRLADKGDGYMEEIHGLREKYRADVAMLIVDDASGCGLATRVFADPEDAFAVVHHECAATSYSVAHEIGHLIGTRHDLVTDKNMTPFPYGHGFVNGTKWRDIMSYKASCNGCPRLPVWSSPKVLIKGEPAGTPDLDNARVIFEQAGRVAAFR